jgi:uncharacterized protein
MAALNLVLGIVFGWVLSRSGAADYDYVQGMFLFEEPQLYGIIGTAVIVLAPALWLLERHGRTASGAALLIAPRPAHPGNWAGSLLFGIGWSITGMCPGPVLVNVGEGKLYALAALAGVLVGTGALGVLYPRLQPRLRLPAVDLGAGDG